jgi:hypothetical protein
VLRHGCYLSADVSSWIGSDTPTARASGHTRAAPAGARIEFETATTITGLEERYDEHRMANWTTNRHDQHLRESGAESGVRPCLPSALLEQLSSFGFALATRDVHGRGRVSATTSVD